MHETLKKHKVAFYQSGSKPFIARKIRPNDPCPCGSGKKAKHCCGTNTRYYTPKDQKDSEE